MKSIGVVIIEDLISLLFLERSTLNKLLGLPVNKKVTISNLVTRLWCIESQPETDVNFFR